MRPVNQLIANYCGHAKQSPLLISHVNVELKTKVSLISVSIFRADVM
jgi:hypothetical protein